MARHFTALLLLASAPLFAQDGNRLPSIDQILGMPEDSISVAVADLVLAKDFYPELRVESFLYTLNYMASRFNYYFEQYTDPDQRVRALNTFLYKKGEWNDRITFSYDDNDLHVTKLSNKFINGYLATKKGSCITLPMMYVILGERLGFPIYASRLPYHFFVRYIPEIRIEKFQENIEATNGGSFVSDSEYRQTFLIPEKPLRNGVYLRTLSKKQYIASLLLINANEWIARKNLDKAKYYLELSMKYDSTFSSAMMNYAMIHLQEAMQLERRMNAEKQTEIARYDICTKHKNQLSPPTESPGRLQRTLMKTESQSSAFQFCAEDGVSKMSKPSQNHPIPQDTSGTQYPMSPELQISLTEISTRYVPLIGARLAVYERYRMKTQELGIVRDYPLSFFQLSSKSLLQYQQKGTK